MELGLPQPVHVQPRARTCQGLVRAPARGCPTPSVAARVLGTRALGLGCGPVPRAHAAGPGLTAIVGDNLYQLVVVRLVLVQVVFVHGLADDRRSLLLAGYLGRGRGRPSGCRAWRSPPQGVAPGTPGDASHCRPRLSFGLGARSPGTPPSRPAPGGLCAGMGRSSQLFLPPSFSYKPAAFFPCHLGNLPAPGGCSPRACPRRTRGTMNPGQRQRRGPALEGREEPRGRLCARSALAGGSGVVSVV